MKLLDGTILNKIISLNSRKAQDKFPLVLSMLVKEDSSKGAYIRITNNNDVSLTGIDGKVNNNTKENHFVPLGTSYWEIGTGKDFEKKVFGDFLKRNDDNYLEKKDAVFVSVTCTKPSEAKKNKLLKKIKAVSKFKDFIIYDATDIANWLNEHINVLLRFYELFEETPSLSGIDLLDTFWSNTSKSTNPNLTTDFILYFNDGVSSKIVDDIKDNLISKNTIKHISSKDYGRRFCLLFTCAAIIKSKDEDLIGKVLVVKNQDCLDFLLASAKNLVLLLDFNCLDLKLGLGINNTIVMFSNYGGDDSIKRLSYQSFEKAIEYLGVDDNKTHRLAIDSGYNYSAFIRRMAVNPVLRRPLWASAKNKNELIPLMLIGSINTGNNECMSVLKSLTNNDTDNYIDGLIYWGEIDDSPVDIEDTVYGACSRLELFDYINIDINNSKLKVLEKYVSDAIVNNPRNEAMLMDIVDGFILLSEKSYAWRNHFIRYQYDLMNKLESETKLKKPLNYSFYKLSRLSPSVTLKYLTKVVNSDESVLNIVIDDSAKKYDTNHSSVYFLMTLERCFVEKELVIEALELLLNLFVKTKNKTVEEEVVKAFSPMSSAIGITNISPKNKTNVLFSFLNRTDNSLAFYDVMTSLSKGGDTSFSISVNSDTIDYEQFKQVVTYDDVAYIKQKSSDWLLANTKGERTRETIETVLDGLYNCDKKSGNHIIEQIEKFINDNQNNDNNLAIINKELLRTINSITKYYNKGSCIKPFSNDLHSLYDKSKPRDLMLKYRYVFESNDFPIISSSRLKDDNWYEIDEEERNTIRKQAIGDLFNNYSEDAVVDYLIKTCNNNIYYVWGLVFDAVKDKDLCLKKLMRGGKTSALREFLYRYGISSIKMLFETLSADEISIICRCLPLRKDIVEYLSSTEYEMMFWENLEYFRAKDVSEDVLFKKLLKYNPVGLLSQYAYLMKDKTYERGISLLLAVIEKSKNGLIEDDHYALEHIVKEMDSMFFTEELSNCEIALLPYLKRSMRDYPLGVKRLFWSKPERFVDFLEGIYLNKNTFEEGSIGRTIYFELEYSFSFSCLVPVDYLQQKTDELILWFNKIMECVNGKDTDFVCFVKKIVVSVLSCCPSATEYVWPNVTIADLMERIAEKDFDDPYEISRIFYTSFINRRGAIWVDDGTAEFESAAKYKQYSDFYSETYKIISRALYYISDSFQSEGENFRKEKRL